MNESRSDQWLSDYRRWVALKAACRKQHESAPGGAVMCICGMGCGGSDACSMLREIRDLIAAIDTTTQPANVREWVERLREVVH